MPKLVQVQIFKYDELSEDVKNKLRNEYEIEDGWYEAKKEELLEKLTNKGFYNVDLEFSGFWSQGDGASFTGNINLEEYLNNMINNDRHSDTTYESILTALINQDITLTENIIKRDKFHRYVHENTTSLYLDYIPCEGFEDNIADLFNSLYDYILKDIRELNIKCYKALEKEYESQTTDDIKDSYYSNLEYNYFKDGRICKDSYIIEQNRIIPERDTFNPNA